MSDTAVAYYQFEEVNLPIIKLLCEAKEQNPQRQTVLDLGCGRARLGKEAEQLGYRVTGIEANPVAIVTAKSRISEIIALDLLQFDEIGRALADRSFDQIIASDIMEHLPYPIEALRFYRKFLSPDGQIIISVPNVALWDIRLRLLFGNFNYTDSGVLDRTHLRFFTLRTALEMLENAGFEVTGVTYDPGIIRAFLPIIKRLMGDRQEQDPGLIVDSGAYRAYIRYILPIERIICKCLPGLFAFRIVMQARRSEL